MPRASTSPSSSSCVVACRLAPVDGLDHHFGFTNRDQEIRERVGKGRFTNRDQEIRIGVPGRRRTPIPRSRSSVVVGRRVSADDDDACGGRGRRARRRTTPDGVEVDGTGARRDARGVASDSRASNAWDRVRWRARAGERARGCSGIR